MKTIPNGKGWFIWQIKRIAGGNPQDIVARAKSQNISWVSIKVNDGSSNYNLRPVTVGGIVLYYVDDIIQPLVDALHAQGIQVFGWGYIYLYNPVKEAQKSIERVRKFGLDGYQVDAESQWANKKNEATSYMNTLRTGLPDMSIGMCSYRFPSVQLSFPWMQALQNADYHCPQVYWAKAHNSAEQLTRSVTELLAKKVMPVVPLGYAYRYEYDGSTPTQSEIQAFHDKAQELNLPASGWYEWGDAINANLEQFVADLNWGSVVPPLTFPHKYRIKDDIEAGRTVRNGLPSTVRLQGGKTSVLLTPIWMDYAYQIQGNPNYQFTNPTTLSDAVGWHNSGAGNKVEQVVFSGNTLEVTRIEGNKAFVKSVPITDNPPMLGGKFVLVEPTYGTHPLIHNFSIQYNNHLDLTTDEKYARIIVFSNPGEELWIDTKEIIRL